ncbi:hypothetical protein HMPREF1492_1472 [Atopobium sp. BS2]|nr:hypothetical protein HMPREF1492_1472 [Atopobium sp. BS2]
MSQENPEESKRLSKTKSGEKNVECSACYINKLNNGTCVES